MAKTDKTIQKRNNRFGNAVRKVWDKVKKAAAKIWAPTDRRLWQPIRKRLGKYVSLTFLFMLLLSFLMWYMVKLSHTYTAEVPMNIDIDGRKMKVTCVAEGTGYRILVHRYNSRKSIQLHWTDIEVTPSASNPGYVIISPYSLQNAISVRNPDLKIISTGSVPEIAL